jgi:HEAT repeat protein/cyclophilin family peptidyl-prolyl cis-trans isomerase
VKTLSSLLLLFFLASPQAQRTRSLNAEQVSAIAQILGLEDARSFDAPAFEKLVQASHPEVRRRAVVAVGRIVDPRGAALLAPLRADKDPDVVAAVAFAYGQLKHATAVDWLAGQMPKPGNGAVSREAARSLGKIRSPEARTALAQFLTAAAATRVSAPVVGEALLAYGRFTTPGDITPILRWTTVADTELRWRAAWALFRLRDNAASPHLLKLTEDPSADVRFWSARGLSPALVSAAGLDVARAAARLRTMLSDPDRRVRTEALRSLTLYDDEASVQAVLGALESVDAWMAVSAAEGLARLKDRASVAVPGLVAAGSRGKPLSLRITALTALAALAPDAAIDLAASLALEESIVARAAAIQVLPRLGPAGQARLDALSADPATKDRIAEALPKRGTRAEPIKRTAEDYRQIVERWVVPAYTGGALPRVVLGTPRGEIEIELHAGDAPLGLEYLVRVVQSGEIVGTEFGRVVPNFVAQQRPIRGDVVLRDEVNRIGLNRGTLAWASAGLDTGRPGYTLGSTPQPHNEGDFTALGHVVRGIDVVDRLELGDRITSAKMR